jgi:NADH-quinone oxidoreductase subunit L
VLGEEQAVVHKIDPLGVSILTVLFALGGIAAAWFVFGRAPVPTTEPARVSPITVAARRNLYADAFNEAVFMRPGMWLDRFLVWLDNRGVDGAVNGVAAAFGGGSGRLRRLQTGFVRSYALSMLGGSVLVVASLLAVRFV